MEQNSDKKSSRSELFTKHRERRFREIRERQANFKKKEPKETKKED